MEKFEKKLLELEVKEPESTDFENELRKNLIEKFIQPEHNYQLQFRFAFGFACIMAFFTFLTIMDPRVALRLNEITFNNFQKVEQPTTLETGSYIADNLQYTTINSPELIKQIDSEGYKEEKAYIIRQYRANNKKSVMVVSEFNSNNKHLMKPAVLRGM